VRVVDLSSLTSLCRVEHGVRSVIEFMIGALGPSGRQLLWSLVRRTPSGMTLIDVGVRVHLWPEIFTTEAS
jgi:hypothetical protein